jgi:multimeric flavodoxin WrbA
MNVLTLLASPRSDGNTSTILGWVEGALRENGHRADRLDLAKLQIAPCKSCFACAESTDAPGCVVMDDAQGVFEKMLAADAVLFATPLYMWSYAGHLKPLLDRTLCMVRGYATSEHRSFVDGKPTALLVACGGPVEQNADAIQLVFPRLADFLKLENRGVWVFPNCTGNKARELAEALVS